MEIAIDEKYLRERGFDSSRRRWHLLQEVERKKVAAVLLESKQH
jgi:hypothetical protein